MAERKRLNIPLGAFDVSVPRHDAADGTLRAIRNLVPDGSPEDPRWSAAEGAAQLGDLTGVLAVGAHVRSRRGELALQAPTVSAGFYDVDTTDYQVRPMPAGRYAMAMGVIDGVLYIAGGAASGGREATTWAYDFKADSYDTDLADMPAAIDRVASAVLGDGLHVVGGNDGTGTQDTHYRYEPANDEWTTLAALPAPRQDGVMVADPSNNTLHYLGGSSDGSDEQATHYVYSQADDSWTTAAAIPAATKHAQVAYDSGQIYVIGGTSSSTIVTTVRRYTISSDGWGTLTALPTERHKGGAAILDGTIYVIGGENSGATDTSVEAYDISGDSWSDPGHTMPDGGLDVAVVAANSDWILAAGGLDGQTALDAMRAYAPAEAERLEGPSVQDLERLVAVTAGGIHVVSPDTGKHRRVWTFASPDDSRKAQFGQIGDTVWIATATGAGTGAPEGIFALIDDEILPLNLPQLPLIAASSASESDSALEGGKYGFRYAWELRDGTIAWASRPYVLDLASAGEPYTLTFSISAFPRPISDAWKTKLRGVAVFFSDEAVSLAESSSGSESPTDRLFNAPYFRIGTITDLTVGGALEWTDVREAITSYPTLDDDQLTRHQIKAAALQSYNKRLFLGDVAYDFRRPQGSLNLVGAGQAVGENNAPVVAIEDFSTVIYVGQTDGPTAEISDPDGDDIASITITEQFTTGAAANTTYEIEYSVDGGSTWSLDGIITDPGSGGSTHNTTASAPLFRVLCQIEPTDVGSSVPAGVEVTIEAADTVGDSNSDSEFVAFDEA